MSTHDIDEPPVDSVPTIIRGVSVDPNMTMEEAFAGKSARSLYQKRVLKLKEHNEEDYYDYTQSIRQAIVAKYIDYQDNDNIALRDNLDAEDISKLLTVLKDIDTVTNNREKVKVNKEKVNELGDVKAIVTEALRVATDHSFQSSTFSGTVPSSQLPSRDYVDGELSAIHMDNEDKDYNDFIQHS